MNKLEELYVAVITKEINDCIKQINDIRHDIPEVSTRRSRLFLLERIENRKKRINNLKEKLKPYMSA